MTPAVRLRWVLTYNWALSKPKAEMFRNAHTSGIPECPCFCCTRQSAASTVHAFVTTGTWAFVTSGLWSEAALCWSLQDLHQQTQNNVAKVEDHHGWQELCLRPNSSGGVEEGATNWTVARWQLGSLTWQYIGSQCIGTVQISVSLQTSVLVRPPICNQSNTSILSNVT